MFRHLGTFAPLALCLFALVIAMGGYGGGEGTEGTETSSSSSSRIEGNYEASVEAWDGLLIVKTTGTGSTTFGIFWDHPWGNSYAGTRNGRWDAVDRTFHFGGERYEARYYAGDTVIEIINMPTPVDQRTVRWEKLEPVK